MHSSFIIFILFNFNLIIPALNGTNINPRPAGPSIFLPNKGEFVNKDILNDYADYGVQLNGFSIDRDGKINYPALLDSLKYAEQTNLDPCTDFYEFVCRGVKNRVDKAKEGKKNESVDNLGKAKTVHNALIVEQIEKFWLDYLSNPELRRELPQEANIASNLLTFFDKCISTHPAEEDEFASALVSQFGLQQFAENDSSPLPVHEFNGNWIQRTHPYNPFFSLDRMATREIGTDGKIMEGNEFKIELIYLNFGKDSLLDLQNWLKEKKFVAKMRNPGVDSEKVQQKLLEIADTIGKINDNNDKNVAAKLNLKEFQKKFGQNGKFNWAKLFRNLFPNAKTEEKSVVKIYYWDSFNQFMEIMQKYGDSKNEIDKAAMSEYLLWSLINSLRMFNEDSFSPLLCIRKFMFNYFPHPLSRLLFAKMGIEESHRSGAMEIYKFARKGLQKMLNESKWHDREHRKYLVEKLEKIFTTIGMDGVAEIPSFWKPIIENEMYKKYNLEGAMNWLEMLVQVRRIFKRNYPQRDIAYTDLSIYYAFRQQISTGDVSKLLPVFHSKFPAEYNFGYFGRLLGHEQTHALQNDNRDMDLMEGGFGAKFWDAIYANEYEKRIKCLRDQYEAEFKKLYPNLTHANTASEDMADNIGVMAGYTGWKLFQREMTKKNGSSPKITFALPLSKYSPEQTFFIASTFPWCFTDRDDPERNEFPQGFDIHSVARMRANIPLMNFPEFATAFQCKPNQAMNPKDRCQFY